jgi:hypothetical protein
VVLERALILGGHRRLDRLLRGRARRFRKGVPHALADQLLAARAQDLFGVVVEVGIPEVCIQGHDAFRHPPENCTSP